MKYNSLIRRQELFVAAAIIAAHATDHGSGFRQRDARFLIDLFLNWVETSSKDPRVRVQNTQIQRYITLLAQEGYARKISRGKTPLFRLTRTGLIELLNRITGQRPLEPEHFFFLYYFLKCYGPRITELIAKEGSQFPPALRIEVEALLDVKALVHRELLSAERELRRLELRATDALKTVELIRGRKKRTLSLEDAIREAERQYPYELNSQKPLHELMSQIPEQFREWELTEGNIRRTEDIWRPMRSLQLHYLEQLKRL